MRQINIEHIRMPYCRNYMCRCENCRKKLFCSTRYFKSKYGDVIKKHE